MKELEILEKFWDEENEPIEVEGRDIVYNERKRPRLETKDLSESKVVREENEREKDRIGDIGDGVKKSNPNNPKPKVHLGEEDCHENQGHKIII